MAARDPSWAGTLDRIIAHCGPPPHAAEARTANADRYSRTKMERIRRKRPTTWRQKIMMAPPIAPRIEVSGRI